MDFPDKSRSSPSSWLPAPWHYTTWHTDCWPAVSLPTHSHTWLPTGNLFLNLPYPPLISLEQRVECMPDRVSSLIKCREPWLKYLERVHIEAHHPSQSLQGQTVH